MAEHVGEFVTFFLDEQIYALDIRLIREVNPNVRVMPVPRSNAHVRGLVNVRGQIILVLDIAVIFGTDKRPVTPQSHIVIIKTSREIASLKQADLGGNPARFGDKPVGLLIDSPGEVTRIPDNGIEPPPPHLKETNARFFTGVARRDNRLISILNTEEILTYGFNTAAGDPPIR